MGDGLKWLIAFIVLGGIALFVEPIKSAIAIGLTVATDDFDIFILNNYLVLLVALIMFLIFNHRRDSP